MLSGKESSCHYRRHKRHQFNPWVRKIPLVKKWQLTNTTQKKINSKRVKDLNVRPDIIKLLEENIGKTLFDINHNNILLDPSPRIMEMKTKINNWDLIKL